MDIMCIILSTLLILSVLIRSSENPVFLNPNWDVEANNYIELYVKGAKLTTV